ncbi:MAG: hypothetical protein AAF787_13105, partial [Chloroflexota bacterium]
KAREQEDELVSVDDLVHERKRKLQQFEQLTLAEALGQFFARPKKTAKYVHQIASLPRTRPITAQVDTAQWQPSPRQVPFQGAAATVPMDNLSETWDTADSEYTPTSDTEGVHVVDEMQTLSTAREKQREALAFGLRLTAFLIVWSGNAALNSVSRTGISTSVATGVYYILAGVAAWLIAELFAEWDTLKAWWQSRGERDKPAPRKQYEPVSWEAFLDWLHPVRLALATIGALGMAGAVAFNLDNQFSLIGVFCWMVSIVAFSAALSSDAFLFKPRQFRLHIPRFWQSGTFIALVLIIFVGGYFRTAFLTETPGQMTSDHVEKLLDAQRVLDGNTQVFFPNNGGREPFQMYAMALFSQLPGLRMDFFALKLLTVVEGLITLPFLWWMGREIIGKENPRFGNAVGLILALLVAVSGWHLSLSRLALRIVLTPLIASLLLIYLGRGMRDNNRDDWLKAGLVLGAGLYMYQAVRMLPVVVILGTLIAVIGLVRNRAALAHYAANFASLVFTSFVVFVPMFAFSLQFPEHFWRRTAGRLLGDSTVQETLEDGSIVTRDPTFGEQIEAFNANLPILWNNIKDALFMFNWKGDVAWINNAPNIPQMDGIVGALFLVGVAAWVVRMVRRRDVVDWLVPMMLFIMLLPSALSIAYPVENPSATRTSGALPVAYLLAAYPLAILVRSFMRLFGQQWVAVGLSAALVGLIAFGSYLQNANTYFTTYHRNYLLSSLPYRQAGDELEQFNRQIGRVEGNAFMIAYPYWWDHRALGIEGGMIDYPNGIVTLEEVPTFIRDSYLRSNEYRFDPNRNILFFLSPADTASAEQLRDWFPDGLYNVVEIPEQNRSYATYRVPALGVENFRAFMFNTTGENVGVE